MGTILVEPSGGCADHRGAVEGARLLIRDSHVEACLAPDTAPPAKPDQRIAVDGWLLPGLVDLQTNGAGGHAVEEATPPALDAVAAQVWRGGAAAFLPTLITARWEALLAQVRACAAWVATRAGEAPGARPLGLHLEGPFLEVPGAHDAGAFVDPTPARIDQLLEAARDTLALVTLACDRDGAPDAVARLRRAGVAVALGHAAGTRQLEACVAAGAGLVTHLFNAMGPIHHRRPGLAGVALDDTRLRCSLIADGVHVHPVMLRNAHRCLGTERTVLVTDSVAAAGMPDGRYVLGGAEVRHQAGVVRDAAGHLAGSALTMSEACRRWLAAVGLTGRAAAVAVHRVAVANPAALLGRPELGRWTAGQPARCALLRADGSVENQTY